MLQRRKGTNNSKIIHPNVPYENCSHLWDIFGEMFEKWRFSFETILPYRVQYNESEYTIKQFNLFYKISPKTKYFLNLEK